MKEQDTTRALRSAGDAWTVGIQLALLLAGCTLGGGYLGRKAGHPEAGLVIGAVVGFLLSLYEVWKLGRRLGAEAAAKSTAPEERSPGGEEQDADE